MTANQKVPRPGQERGSRVQSKLALKGGAARLRATIGKMGKQATLDLQKHNKLGKKTRKL